MKFFLTYIAEIFELGMKEKWIDETGLVFKVLDSQNGKYVSGVLKGSYKFKIGVKQIIDLDEEDIIVRKVKQIKFLLFKTILLKKFNFQIFKR